MKPIPALCALCALSLFSLSSVAATPPAGHPPMAEASPKAAANPLLTQKAKVLIVVDVPNYTYLEVVMDQSEDKKPIWLAGPTTAVNVGDTVRFDAGTLMENFHSNFLKRTFDKLLFVSSIEVSNEN